MHFLSNETKTKMSMPTQSSTFHFFHKINNRGELDSELITTDEIRLASIAENGSIECTLKLPALRDIGRCADVRITKFSKYNV